MIRRQMLTALAVVSLALPSIAAPPTLEEVPGYEDFAARCAAAGEALGVPGFAVALVHDGEVTAAQGFGVRDAGPDAAPVDAETMFYIASCTKTYVAAACCLLAQDGRLDLDETVATYLPEFRLADAEATRTLTVRDLLCHRLGVNCGPAVWLDAYTGQITDGRFFRHLARVTPRGTVSYTNTHFTIAGRVIERVSGRAWRDYLDDRLFTPAGLRRTTGYASEMYTDPNAAYPLEVEGGAPVRARLIKDDSVMHAAGGLGTTAIDGARWVALAMNRGAIDGRRVLTEELASEMLEPQSRLDETQGQIRRLEGFGLGWQLGSYRGLTPYATHGGGYIGTAAHLSFLPDDRIGLVVLANGSPSGQGLCDVICVDFYDHELGVEDSPDLTPSYVERLGRYEQRMAQREAELPAALTGDRLSRPVREYLGTYHSDDMGDIELSLEGGSLVARDGIMRLSVRSADERPEAFVLATPSLNLMPGRFVLDPASGVVTGLEVEVDDGETVRYRRR